MPKLTEKQKRFCEEYLIDLNAVQAAIRAGYSEKTARFASQWINERNLQKPTSKYIPEMREYIDSRLEELHNERTADAQEVVEYLTSVMRGESESEEIVLKGVGKGSQRIEKVQKKPSEKDKLKAAELLGKRFGMFKERVELDGELRSEKLSDVLNQLGGEALEE